MLTDKLPVLANLLLPPKIKTPPETVVVENQKAVDSLKTIIASYEQKQKAYDSTVSTLNTKIANLKNQIAQDDKSITELKNYFSKLP